MIPPVILAAFPDLATDDPVVTHPSDPRFNCVAWAAGVVDAVWWPADPDGYWPPGISDELTVAAMVAALGTVGYVSCAGGEPEPGFEKVAVYARSDVPTHVARQLADGRWSSKLGRSISPASRKNSHWRGHSSRRSNYGQGVERGEVERRRVER
jgi:hypothetical protein